MVVEQGKHFLRLLATVKPRQLLNGGRLAFDASRPGNRGRKERIHLRMKSCHQIPCRDQNCLSLSSNEHTSQNNQSKFYLQHMTARNFSAAFREIPRSETANG